MNTMVVGKLYEASKLYWLVAPKKLVFSENAAQMTELDMMWSHSTARGAAGWASSLTTATWSDDPDSKAFTFIRPKSMFVLLVQEHNWCKILSSDGATGWIYLKVANALDIVEVV
jgi:SH3-like domain-containing protein